MKKIVVLFFAVLFTCPIIAACGSGTDDGESNDVYTDTAGPDITGEAADPEFTDVTADGGTDDSTDFADSADVALDVKDPLEEYLFIEGTWKRVECDGGPCPEEKIKDLSIESWDDTLGAKVIGLNPFVSIYLKKNAETGQFEFENPEGSFSLISGTADPILFKIVTTHYMTSNPGEIHTIVWEKIE